MYKEVISPFLDVLPSEFMHKTAREALHLAEATPLTLKLLESLATEHHERFKDERLLVSLGGISLENPIMVGAGWDKPGRAIRGLHALGFSAVVEGSMWIDPWPGNKGKRQDMVGPGVAWNRLGFNSPGMYKVARNNHRYEKDGIPRGISMGKNASVPNEMAAEGHARIVRYMYDFADFWEVNVSSPNTKDLRSLQDKDKLDEIIKAINAAQDERGFRKPVFIKIAPDLADGAVMDVIRVVLDNRCAGITGTNTTINQEIKAKYGLAGKDGGISGNDPEFRQMATDKVRFIYKETRGEQHHIDIIGAGGVNDGPTALEKIQAGARVVQIVTGIREVGPTLPGKINRWLADYLDREGISDINELVGTAA